MKVLNFGSLNYDYVYYVDHIMMPKETQSSTGMNTFFGGKGANQSVALARAGIDVYHAGLLGEDGQLYMEALKANHVNIDYIKMIPGKSGHTIIQVDKQAQNSILLYGGANQSITKENVDEVLAHFEKGDMLLLQNEISNLPYIIDKAYEIGMLIVLNPSPFDDGIMQCDLSKVSMFFLNEVEGFQMTGKKEPQEILSTMMTRYPTARVVLTLGEDGAIYRDKDVMQRQGIYPVTSVDTTAAGDTFLGYFIAGMMKGMTISEILKISAGASALSITRDGAMPAIPTIEEVTAFIKAQKGGN